ncbi:MAG: matrixin family metalloprotease [Labilithrix sp.]|nr:matrixin family metalloprotease [Labilithrix sp.]
MWRTAKHGKQGSTFAAFVAGAAILAVAGDASAFCRSTTCRATSTKECKTDQDNCPAEGEKLFWPTSCISYAVNELGTQDLDPVDTRDIIKKTFQAWTDVTCPDGKTASMAFQERDPVACKRSEYNKEGRNVNVVLFQDDDWKYRGIDGTLAKTSVTYNDQTGEIYDADIEVNTANNTVTITDDPRKVQYDLQAILTHEVGHFIGIAHSSDPSAVMFASYSPGSVAQRTLTPDDVKAVCAIYPPGSGVVCNVEPRGGFDPECPDPADAAAACTVASAPGEGNGATKSAGASLAVLGLGALATTLARRRASNRGSWRRP